MSKTLLSEKDIKNLEEWTSDGYFYKAFYYLEDFIQNGIDSSLFTEEQALEDLQTALWYAYAGNNIAEYEYYYKVAKRMPYSEKNAKGCGAWYYRYSVALVYCGDLDKAFAYAKKGVEEEPDYPWGWLNLAQLQYYFNYRDEAVKSVQKGLSLVPGDYEFTTLAREIEQNLSYEEMLCHYIKPEDDALLHNDSDSLCKTNKLREISGVVCDSAALAELKTLFSAKEWAEDCPYCSCTEKVQGNDVKFIFEMNRAALSKIDFSVLKKWRESIEEDSVWKEKYNIKYKLREIAVNREYLARLTYCSGKSKLFLTEYRLLNQEDELDFEQAESGGQNEKIEDIALTLYKRGEKFSYAQCWFENNTIVKHLGTVGEAGDIKTYKNCSAEDYKIFLDIFSCRYEKSGYTSWREHVKQTVLIRTDVKNISVSPSHLYEMISQALEQNVVGFLDDWGYYANEDEDEYAADFYLNVADKELAVKIVQDILDANSIGGASALKETIDLEYVPDTIRI